MKLFSWREGVESEKMQGENQLTYCVRWISRRVEAKGIIIVCHFPARLHFEHQCHQLVFFVFRLRLWFSFSASIECACAGVPTGPLICHFSCTLHVSIIMYSHRIDANGFFFCSIVIHFPRISRTSSTLFYFDLLCHMRTGILKPAKHYRRTTAATAPKKTQPSIRVWKCGWMDWMRYSFCCVCFFRHLNTRVYPYRCFHLSFVLFSVVVFAWVMRVLCTAGRNVIFRIGEMVFFILL